MRGSRRPTSPAFNTIITRAGVATQAVLAGALDPVQGGVLPGLQAIREAIAAAITTPSFPPQAPSEVAKVPSAGAQTFSLSTPVETGPAPTAVDENAGSGAVGTGAETGAAAKTADESPSAGGNGSVEGGNVFTPGATSTKGGRHRADSGPGLAQGLKDAAEKTIKGFTGLGRDKKSASSTAAAVGGSESGSGSSGSGGSSSSASGK